MLILALILFGLVIGWVAQVILGYRGKPNAESLGAGLVGSFVGGLLFSLIAGDGISIQPSGIIGSIVGAIVVLLIWRAWRGAPKAPPATCPAAEFVSPPLSTFVRGPYSLTL